MRKERRSKRSRTLRGSETLNLCSKSPNYTSLGSCAHTAYMERTHLRSADGYIRNNLPWPLLPSSKANTTRSFSINIYHPPTVPRRQFPKHCIMHSTLNLTGTCYVCRYRLLATENEGWNHFCHETTQRILRYMVSDTGSHTWTPVEDTQTYLDPRDVQVQGTGHQEADRKHQQQQDSHAPGDGEHTGHC